MIGRAVRAVALLAAAALGCGAAAAPFDWRLPPGVSPPPVPASNPMSSAKVELGRRLFYDADLSVDGTVACAGCHEQRHAFADTNATHAGVHGEPGRRNVPGLANVGYLSPLTWADPAQTTLELQASVPVLRERPAEMGMHGQEAEIVRRLAADGCYRRQFADAFPETGGHIDFVSVAGALAAFERTLLAWSSPYDLSRRGGPVLSETARQGERVFAAACASCHAGPQFTDGRFHRLGDANGASADPGVFEITGREEDRGAFRTPSLRNAALTAPYLHDGSARTLGEALRAHGGLGVSKEDEAALVAFLNTLNDSRIVSDERLSMPRSFCGVARVR